MHASPHALDDFTNYYHFQLLQYILIVSE